MTALHKFAPASELGPAEDYPVGSVEWAERISNRLQIGANSVNQHTVHHLWETIKAIWSADPHPWEIWPVGHPFRTPNDYCLAVSGHPWEFLVDVVAEFKNDTDLTAAKMRADLARAQAKAVKQGERTDLTSANKRRLGKQGADSHERLLRRLARDYPDTLDAYERGEYPSVRAAAIAAGIVKQPTPLEQLRRAWCKTSAADRATFLAEVNDRTV